MKRVLVTTRAIGYWGLGCRKMTLGEGPLSNRVVFSEIEISITRIVHSMKWENTDEKAKTIWSPLRMAVLIAIWSLVTPLRIQITQGLSYVNIYAGAWGLGRLLPYSESTYSIFGVYLVFDLFYTLFMFPYYSLGLVIAYLVWKWTLEGNITKSLYIERILSLQVVHIAIVLLFFPCPYSSTIPHTCIPTPTTGIFALLFMTRVVKEISSPWDDSDSSQGAWDTMKPQTEVNETQREDIEIPRLHRVRSQLRRFILNLFKRTQRPKDLHD